MDLYQEVLMFVMTVITLHVQILSTFSLVPEVIIFWTLYGKIDGQTEVEEMDRLNLLPW